MKASQQQTTQSVEVSICEFEKELGERFKKERKRRELSADAVGKLIGKTSQAISSFELGNSFSLDMAFKYAHAMGLDKKWFNVDKVAPSKPFDEPVRKPKIEHDHYYRLEVAGSTKYAETHVLSSVQKRSGCIVDCTITTVGLSKTYWRSLKEDTAVALKDKLAAIGRDFTVKKFSPKIAKA